MVATAKPKRTFPAPNYEESVDMIRKAYEGMPTEEVAAAYHGAKQSLNLPVMFCCAHELHLREMERESNG